jgi:TPR repeat protein
MKPVWMVRLSRWQPDTGRATNSLNVEKTRGGNLLGGPSPLGPVVIETEHPRHRLVSGVTKLLSLIFVPCLVYLMIGGVNRYLSLPESMLATANAPLPAEVAAKPLAPQEPPKSADASAAPAPATPPNATVTDEAAPSVAVPGSRTSPPPALSAETLSEFLTRGDMLFRAGAVDSARLFYAQGASSGDSTAALRLGKTFDPTFLDPADLDVAGGDPVQAAYWYRRARDLGSAEANALLKHVEASDIPPTLTLAHPVPANDAAPSVAATPDSAGADTAPAGARAMPALPTVSATTTKPSGYGPPTVPKGTPANAATPLPAEVAATRHTPQAPPSAEPAPTSPLVHEAPEREVVAAVVAPTPEAPSRVAAPSPTISPNQQRLTGAEIAALLARGDSLLGAGDIASARLFYERASDAGDGRAALRLGATYDPGFLDRVHLPHLQGVAQALSWYRRARDLGESEAELWIQGLETKSGR